MRARPIKASNDPWVILTRALFVLFLFLVLRTFPDYGMSWDQYYRQTEGRKKLVYYQNLLSGNWQKYDNAEDLYPGFYDLTLQVVNLAQPFGPGILGLIYTDHLLTGLIGIFTAWAAYKIGRKLGGRRVGFLSALFLFLFPHFYGHMFINPKDIPFACAYLWALYFTLKLLDKPLTWRLIAELMVVYGLTLGVRMGGVFFFAFMAVAFVLRAFLRRQQSDVWPALVRYAGLSVVIALGAFVVLLPWWPFAHPNPVGTIWHTLTRVASYPWNGPVLLNGQVYPSTALPWYYLPEMLAITAPLFLGFLGVVGVVLALASLLRKLPREKLKYLDARRLSIFFVAFAMFLPVAAVIMKHATLYDGIRHFLFVLGPWAILAALTFDRLLRWTEEKAKKSRRKIYRQLPAALSGLLVLCATGVVIEQVRLHPYQYIYYNELAGGIENACINFETDYWGTSHREAVMLLAQHLALQGDTKTYKVTSPMAPWLVENFLPSNLVYTTDPRQADFFISFLRFNAHMWSDGTVMEDCIVQRKGVPLAIVRDRREIVKKQQQGHQAGQPESRLISAVLELLPAF